MQLGRRQPDEGLDEAPRGRAVVDGVEVVEDEQQVARDVVLEDVGDERRGGLCPGQDLRLAGRLDGALDRGGRSAGSSGRGSRRAATIPAANVPSWRSLPSSVYQADGMPGRDMGDERRLAEPGAGDDDGEPAGHAARQATLELGAGQGAGRIGRRQQLGCSSGCTETGGARHRTRVDGGRRGHGPPGA